MSKCDSTFGLVIINGRGVDYALRSLSKSTNLHDFNQILIINLRDEPRPEGLLEEITYVNSSNTPLVNKNRLKGLEVINTDFVHLLDDDDWIDGEYISQIRLQKNNPIQDSVFILGGSIVDNSGKIKRKLSILSQSIVNQCVWGGYSRVVLNRKQALKYFEKILDFTAFQDQALWILLSSYGITPSFIKGDYVFYEEDSAKVSISGSYSKAISGYLSLIRLFIFNSSDVTILKKLAISIGINRAVFKRLIRPIALRVKNAK